MEEWKRLRDQEAKRQKVKGGKVGKFEGRNVGAGVALA